MTPTQGRAARSAPRALAAMAIAIVAAACAASGNAFAQAFPTQPIRILVPNPAGGPTDLAARTFGDKLAALLGQPVIVDYRPGGNGAVVNNATIAAPADGHTIAMSTIGGQVLTPVISSYLANKRDVDAPKPLTPVSQLAEVALVLVVTPQTGATNLRDFIAYAKARPGKLNFASTGVGGSDHLSMEMFNKAVGIEAVHIPNKGGVAAMNSMLAGETQFGFAASIGQVLPQHQAGKLRIIATGGSRRSVLLPDVPTIQDAAGLAGFDVASWIALFVRSETDKRIVARLSEAIQKAGEDNELRTRLLTSGLEVRTTTPEAMAEKVDADYRKWSNLLFSSKIQVN